MKKSLYYSMAVVVMLLSAVSCSKPMSEKIVGHYHFKMSGNMVCNCTSYDSVGVPVAYSFGERFLLKAQSGTMNVIKTGEDEYIVNMSVAMFGDELSFKATLKDDVLYLGRHDVVVRVVREGVSSTISNGSSQSVFIGLSGQGKLYDETFMFQMVPDGYFYSVFDGLDWECNVVDDYDIVCAAERL